MQPIKITKKYKITVDKEHVAWVKSQKWYSRKNSVGQIYFNNKNGSLHRLIMNCPENMVVDHINGDTLDNQKSNLRICTKLQNQYNQKKHKGKRHSKYKGVTFRKDLNSRPWEAFIYPNNKSIRLGYFKTEKEAAKAYDKAARKYYGKFANLNFSKDIK